MRKHLYTILISIFTMGSSIAQYEISVSIEGLSDTSAFLGYHLGKSKYIQDTTTMDNGNAVFKGEKSLAHGVYFLYTPNYFLEFVVTDEQTFSISSDSKNPLLNKKVSGSEQNEIFLKFQVKLAETQTSSKELQETLKDATSREDSIAIYDGMREIDKANKKFQVELAEEYPESYVATFLNLIRKPEDIEASEGLTDQEIRQFKFQHYKDHFFDGIDFGYEGILRTPLFHDRILEYVDKLTSPDPDSLINAVDYLVNREGISPEVFRYIIVTLTNKFSQPKMMGHDAVFVHLAQNYYLSGRATWADEKVLEEFRNAVNDLRPNLIGEIAPSLDLLDTTLSPISLYDIDAKYTVLFFYDPDCGHCKKQAPLALDFYHEYRNEGVEAVGVCVATDLDKWRKFISERSLDWLNLADPFYKSNFRKEYNIVSTPTIYILDKDKKIIGKRIAVEQLDEFINARLRMDGD